MLGNERIESLLKEAEIYHIQGLLDQAEEKYMTAADLIGSDNELLSDISLLNSVKEKLREVKASRQEIESEPETPELTEDLQDLIGQLFSFSKNSENASIEGAIAMARFGQYDRALIEFEKLINQDKLPLTAAKNMLRCHLALASPDAAVLQYRRWKSRDIFTESELDDLRLFLNNILKDKKNMGIIGKVSGPNPPDLETPRAGGISLELLSVRVTLDCGDMRGQTFDLDITSQFENNYSFIIRSRQKYLIKALVPGTRLSRIQCYSSGSVYNASGFVSKSERISSGPRCGDFAVELTIEGPEQTVIFKR